MSKRGVRSNAKVNMSPEFLTIRTFFIGVCLGVVIFFTRYQILKINRNLTNDCSREFSSATTDKISSGGVRNYSQWFDDSGFRRHVLSDDELRYSDLGSSMTEAQYLFEKIPVVCVIFTSSHKNVLAINDTWSTSCNRVLFYSDRVEGEKHRVPVMKGGATSSFHILCDVIRQIVREEGQYLWALFVKDDMFALPENLRYLVAPLDAEEGHYLGHAVSFWGVEYNTAFAGFALSRGALRRLAKKFPHTPACVAGGKYWKQEDLYLGRHLRSMGILPMDTRDESGGTRFLGYDLDKMMFPGSMHRFSNYYTRTLHPVKCCGSRVVTFPVLSSTELYKYHYMIYKMRVFSGGFRGNKPAPTEFPDTKVWQDFLQERGLPLNSSATKYEIAWHEHFENVTVIPGTSKHGIQLAHSALGGPDKLFNPTNMPEILVRMLNNYTAKRLLNRKSDAT